VKFPFALANPKHLAGLRLVPKYPGRRKPVVKIVRAEERPIKLYRARVSNL
jgi:hypothetical protein